MLPFKEITLEDKVLLTEKLQKLNCKLLNYNYVVLFIYRNIIHFQYALSEDFLIIKTHIDGRDQFLFPVGEGDISGVLTQIKEYAFSKGKGCHFFQFCDNNAQILLEWADSVTSEEDIHYNFYDVRGEFEYIYNADDLILLEGHAYKPKRNHINHFLKHYSWSEERINSANLQEVISFSKEWDRKKEISPNSRLHLENIALYEALDHYFDLGIEGLLIRVENKIVAFSIGCPLCNDTFLVLFEKADWEINGSYTMINREFVKNIAKGFRYINRAEDGGVEGLRKAKMSYNPVFLQKVFHLDLYYNPHS